MYNRQIEPGIFTVGVLASRWYVVGFHDLIALQGLQMDVETPETMQVLEHFIGGVAQRFAVVLLMTQGQGAIPTPVDA